MQRHEQIEKDKTLNQSLSPQVSSSFRGARPSNTYSTTPLNNHSNVRPSTTLRNIESPQHQHMVFNRPNTNYDDSKQNHQATVHQPADNYQHQNSYYHETPLQQRNNNRIWYLCNKPGHVQNNCPDALSSPQQHFQQRRH